MDKKVNLKGALDVAKKYAMPTVLALIAFATATAESRRENKIEELTKLLDNK